MGFSYFDPPELKKFTEQLYRKLLNTADRPEE
jgi:hypothetical protein